ncbi:hypothetical protein C8R43DRAFT_1128504 [Mycena crocata]|nr:hypothetical protein C8R43DRAFT_1128504 [Mycena crocata]
MGRRKNEDGKGPGRVSLFTGEKLAWLETFKDEIINAGKNEIGPIYTKMTNRFCVRYGYILGIYENVPGDPDDVIHPPEPEPGDTAEVARREAYRKSARTKLSQWCRNKYKGKKLHAAAINKILKTMRALAGPGRRPVRTPNVVLYSKLHYTAKIKPGFDNIWKEAKETLPASARISMSQDYVHSCWAKETEEFRAEIGVESDRRFAEEMVAWKAGRSALEQSAEEYHDALESLGDFAIPFADALSEFLGAHVAILVVGPVGKAEGEVCLRTVFSDTANGATTKTWAEFDRREFSAMEKSITRYGRAFYTKAQCRARAWPPLETPDISQLNNLIPMPQTQASPAYGEISAAQPPQPQPLIPTTPPQTPVVDEQAAVAAQAVIVGVQAAGVADLSVSTAIQRDARLVEVLDIEMETETAVEEHPEWADGLRATYAYLAGKQWGQKWQDLLLSLVRFEVSHGHVDAPFEQATLPYDARPWEIPQWMKEKRRAVDFDVSDSEHGAFGERVMKWWKAMGPPKRFDTLADGTYPDGAGLSPIDWLKISVPGRNGIQTFLRALGWWGQAVWNEGVGDGIGGGDAALANDAAWNFLIEDVAIALNLLATTEEEWRLNVKATEEGEEEEGVATTKAKGRKKGGKKKAPAKRKAMDVAEDAPPAKARHTGGRSTGKVAEPVERAQTPPIRPHPRPRRLARMPVEEPVKNAENTTVSDASDPVASAGNIDAVARVDTVGPVASASEMSSNIPEDSVVPVASASDAASVANEPENSGQMDIDEQGDPFANLSPAELLDLEMEKALDPDADEDEDDDVGDN